MPRNDRISCLYNTDVAVNFISSGHAHESRPARRVLEGRHLAEDSVKHADLETACRGIRSSWWTLRLHSVDGDDDECRLRDTVSHDPHSTLAFQGGNFSARNIESFE